MRRPLVARRAANTATGSGRSRRTAGVDFAGAGIQTPSPRELLEELAAVKGGDVVLPTRNSDGSAGATLMIRCVTRPDEHTAVLLNRLGIEFVA